MQKANFPFKAVPQSHWPLPSSAHRCVLCNKAFGLFQVPENCRGCGRVCCSACLSEHLVLPGQPGTAPVPVCPICAKSITRTHEEAEMAMERCQLLEEILNEQALQAEKLRSDLREQLEENKLLHHEKERLKATVARMEIEAEVAAAKAEASAQAALASAAAAPAVAAPVASPTMGTSPASSPAKPDSETSVLGEAAGVKTEEALAAAEERLNKKKRQLDVREATLKDALKKVSADAAKNADQRVALQEQEKQLTALVTSKFTALFEDERQRLEDVCMEAVTSVQGQYSAFVQQQQDAAVERRRRYEQVMEERQQRVAAELAEVRASRDALQRQLEAQKELTAELEAAALHATAKATTTTAAAAAEAQQQQPEREPQHSDWEKEKAELQRAAAAAAQRAEVAEDDLQRLQAEVAATTAQYAEEAQTRETAFAAYETEQRQMQQRLEGFVKSIRVQQDAVAADTAASVAAAVEAAQCEAAAAQEKALASQQRRLEARAAAEKEAAVQASAQQHASALQALTDRHADEIKALECTAQEAQRQLQELRRQQEHHTHTQSPATDARAAHGESEPAQAAAAAAASAAKQEQERADWTAKMAELKAQLQEAEQQREAALRTAASAAATVAEARTNAVADLEAQHCKEKDALERKLKEVQRAQAQQQEGQLSQDRAWKDEKTALQKTCKELETRLESRKTAAWQLQQQLRDCKQQLSDLQAQSQKKSAEEEAATVSQARAATAMQRSAAAIVKEVQQTQQRLVAEHTAALAQLRSGLQEAARAASAAATSAKEKKAREAARQLQTQVAVLQQQNDATQKMLHAEQERSSTSEAKMEKLTAALHALQSTEQQQRQVIRSLQEAHQSVLEELEAVRAEAAAQDTLVRSTNDAANVSATASDLYLDTGMHLLEVQQHWVEQQSHLESVYFMALYAVLQHEWTSAMNATVGCLAAEEERQRQLRARNAKALENTTSTIKEVQEDMRARAQALVERQAAVEQQEHRVAEKKKRVDAVCRNLYVVASALRLKHRDDDASEAVEEVVRSARVMGEDV